VCFRSSKIERVSSLAIRGEVDTVCGRSPAFDRESAVMMASVFAVSLFVLSPTAFLPAPQEAEVKLTPEQLDELVAPVALYPDALLTQVLIASTYPLEIVEAQRWLAKNPKLEGTALETALKDREWDPSVKSLCAFPDVINRMSDKLDWTQDLGNAFLGQQADVLAAVQRMRAKAKEAGSLKSTPEQTVKVEDNDIIIIESSDPEVIYVPTYSPAVVYTSAAVIAFSVAYHHNDCCWSHCDWHGGDVDIDVNRYNEFNRRTDARPTPYRGDGAGKNSWKHDGSHRRGVNYGKGPAAKKYGPASGANAAAKDRARGYDRSPSTSKPATSDRAASRPATSDRAASRPASTDRATSRPAPQRDTAFSGAQNRSRDNAASSRGASSRGAARGGGRGGRR
jgi:uncharacterized protein DUF3300